MKVHYQIVSEQTGMLLLRNRRVAKALGSWLNERGYPYRDSYFIPRSYYYLRSDKIV